MMKGRSSTIRGIRGYSLVEVIVAAALLGIGMTAAAIMVHAIVRQEESNTVHRRAANLQEQASRLFQLGMNADQIRNVLPENCVTDTTPTEGTFHITFSPVVTNTINVQGTTTNFTTQVEVTVNTLIYTGPPDGEGTSRHITNHQTVVRPTIR